MARERTPISAGDRFARLEAVEFVGLDRRNNVEWRFKCDCGNQLVSRVTSVRCGYTVSCGCHRADVARANGRMSDGQGNRKHGLRRTPEYSAWAKMRQRTNNPRDPKYPDYGGRGITVCKRWLSSFENFYADMGPKPSPQHSIDRKNNALGYMPSNCRWATAIDQASNRRARRSSKSQTPNPTKGQ